MTLYKNLWLFSSFCMTFFTIPYWPLMPSKLWIVFLCLQILLSCVYSQLRWISGTSVALILIIAKGNIIEFQHKHLFSYGQNTTITGKVDSFFKQNSFGFRGEIEVHQIGEYKFSPWIRPHMLLYAPVDLQIGDTIQASVKLKPIVGLKNEVGFDAENYYFAHNILAKAFVKNEHITRLPMPEIQIRRWLYERFFHHIQDLKHRGLALAISFANRTELTNDDWHNLQQSGLAHLVAISGLHIGIAYLLGFGLGTTFTRLGVCALWLPAFTGLVFALTYSWLAGFSVTTTRAFAMVAINVGLSLLRIRVSTLYRLLLTLVFVLCLFPFAIFSSSFWLSFIAVSIVFINSEITKSVRSKIWQVLLVNGLLSIAMMPVSAWFFGGVSLLSGLFNLVFIPLFSALIVPVLFALLLMTALSVHLPSFVWSFWDSVLGLVPYLSHYADGYWLPVSAENSWLLLTLVLLLLLSFVLTCTCRILLVVTALSVFMLRGKDNGSWSVDVLDVGQGSAILLQKNDHYILYDTGKSWPGGSISESVISPLLVYKGVSSLDGLIISHIDNDHAGGEPYILRKWHPKWVMSSRVSFSERSCLAGKQWHWEGLDWLVVWPEQLVVKPRNSHSCVIRVSDQYGNSVLLTGDISKQNEWDIIKQQSPLRSTIVMVPHHGSATSSSSDFIDSVQAEYAIASLARDNPWHFPKSAVVQKYHAADSQWLDTAHSGQIHITFSSGGYQIRTMRQVNGEPWYRQMLRKKVE